MDVLMTRLLVTFVVLLMPGNLIHVKGQVDRLVTCKKDGMLVEISGLGNLTELGYEKSDFHLLLNSTNCQPKVFDGEKGRMIYDIPLKDCGTVMSINVDNKEEYTNTIHYDFELREESGNELASGIGSGVGSGLGSGEGSAVIDIYAQNVTCIYNKNNYVPVLLSAIADDNGNQGFKDSDVLRLTVSSNDSQAELHLTQCWVGSSANTTYTNQREFMKNGCAAPSVNNAVTLTCNSKNNSQTVEIRREFFQDDESGKKIYLHCTVTVCKSGDPNSTCSANCCPFLPRERRSLVNVSEPEYGGTYQITAGPYEVPVLVSGTSPPETGGVSTGVIVGAAVGSTVGLILIIGLIYFCVARRPHKIFHVPENNNQGAKPGEVNAGVDA